MSTKQRSKHVHPILFSIIVALVTGCISKPPDKSVEQMLQEMNVGQTNFEAMTACQQIEIFTTVGLHYLDRDHATVLVPDWMDTAIDANPPESVADCIATQGFQWLERLDKEPENREQNSFAIHALVYKAENRHLLIYPRVNEFLHSAVCDHDPMYSFRLTLIHYITSFHRAPEYGMERDSEERMKSELCK